MAYVYIDSCGVFVHFNGCRCYFAFASLLCTCVFVCTPAFVVCGVVLVSCCLCCFWLCVQSCIACMKFGYTISDRL